MDKRAENDVSWSIRRECGLKEPYMDCHLYAWLSAGAFEHHIKPVLLTKDFEEEVGILFCFTELFLGRFCPWTRRKAKYVFGKTVRLGEGEASLIDVHSDDT